MQMQAPADPCRPSHHRVVKMAQILFASLALISGTVQAEISSDIKGTSAAELSPASSRKIRTLNWSLQLAGDYESEGKNESLAIMTDLGLELEMIYSDQLRLVLAPEARFYSARAQAQSDSDNFEDHIYLSEAFVELKPVPLLSLRAGSLSQRTWDQPQLISSGRSFPAAQIQVSGDLASLSGALTLQKSVPTSYSYNAQRADKEALPGLTVVATNLSYGNDSNLSLSGQLGAMKWENLPAKVAFNSQKLGNTTPSESDFAASSHFKYGFDTAFANAQVTLCQSCPWGIGLSGRRSHNRLAPADSADAQSVGLNLYAKTAATEWSANIMSFFAESDVTPASYSASALGNTNRQGTKTQLNVTLPRYETTLQATWTQARPIAATPNQFDFNTVFLGVETNGKFLQ